MQTFKEFLLIEMSQEIDDIEFNFTRHFIDQLKTRAGKTIDAIQPIFQKIRSKLKDLPPKGDFLFKLKSDNYGVVAAWDAYDRAIHMITFLPPGSEFFAKGTTQQVVIESKTYTIIEID